MSSRIWRSLGLQLCLIKSELAAENVSKLNPICFEVSLWSQKKPNAGYEQRCPGSFRKCWGKRQGKKGSLCSFGLVWWRDLSSERGGESRASSSPPHCQGNGVRALGRDWEGSSAFADPIEIPDKLGSTRIWAGRNVLPSLHTWRGAATSVPTFLRAPVSEGGCSWAGSCQHWTTWMGYPRWAGENWDKNQRRERNYLEPSTQNQD